MYRENIWDFLNSSEGKVRILVVPKNTGLKGYAWKVLKEANLELEKAVKVDETTLRYRDLTVLLRRGEDIPQVVLDQFRRGNPAMGLTGDDLFDEFRLRNPENRLKLENTYDWYEESARYRRPALCLINPTGELGDIPLSSRVAVNGKYEYMGRLYLSRNDLLSGREFTLTIYQGDLEAAVAESTNDCCIDTVYTGKTIDNKRLKVVEIFRLSDLALISPFRKNGQDVWERTSKYIPKKMVIRT